MTTAIDHALDRARGGAGAVLFLLGEAGLGKTTMLLRAVVRARAEMQVKVARGDAMESALPFGLLIQAIGELGVANPASDLEPRGALDMQAQRFQAALEWVRSVGPVLLGLDDLHWADAESLAVLSFLARRISDYPVVIVATLRPWPPPAIDACRSMVGAGFARIERLRPLSEGAAGALLERIGDIDDLSAKRAVTLCAGNPLLLEQVVRAVGRGETLPDPTGSLTMPFGDELLLARFAGVDRVALACAQAGSVLGSRFRADVAAQVARVESHASDLGIEALCRSGLVRELGGAVVEFTHPLFGQALYEDIPGPVRSGMHARAFAALRGRGMDVEAAEHAVRGDLRGDPTAIELLVSIGRAALGAGAPVTAAERLGAAIDLAGDAVSPDIVISLAEAMVACGRPDATGILESSLRSELSPALRIHALRMLARALSLTGANEQAAARFDEAVSLAELHDPNTAVDALLDHALTTWFTVGPKRSYPLVLRAKEIAVGIGGAVRSHADAGWGFIALLRGDASGVDVLNAAARPLVADPRSEASDMYAHWGILSLYGDACTLLEHFEQADEVFRTLGAAAQQIGAMTTIAGLACNHTYLLVRMGRLDEALALAQMGVDLIDVVPFIEPYAAVGIAHVLQLQGEREECTRWCDRVAANAPAGPSSAKFFLLDIHGHRARRDGRLTEASDIYLELESIVMDMGIGEPCLPAWGRHAVTAHIGCGRDNDARRVLEWLEQSSIGLPCRFARIAAATGRALLAEHDGKLALADAQFATALGLHREVSLPVEKVETLLEFGSYLRRTGRPMAARPVLAEAVALCDDMGAGWLGELASDELRVAGGRRRHPPEPERLTPAEQRVQTLAAAGRSNRDIARQLVVSETTIETHLRHIYTKLGIHSRRDLMARLSKGMAPTTRS